MRRYEYKGYWIEIFLECEGEENDERYFYCASIEFPNEGGVGEVGEEFVTLAEAKVGAEKHIDMLIAAPESEVNFFCEYEGEFVFNQPEAWGSAIIDF